MSYQEMKHRGLIYAQTITDIEVYLNIVQVLTRSQEVNISDVLKVSL